MTRFAVIAGKCISKISSLLHFGAGATWPGEVALRISPHILSNLSSSLTKGIILVAGTNGKTTTSLMISHILKSRNKKVILNSSGANLLNGVVSAFIQHASWEGNIDADFGVFEIDENTLPIVLKFLKLKVVIVLLNLFRDQLDRYGEVDVIAQKWRKALTKLPHDATIILNSDDPQIAYLGKDVACNVIYFGIEDEKYATAKKEHATDSIFCLHCGARLLYTAIYYSHLGDWYCPACGQKRPKSALKKWRSPLPGIYNLYNTLAAVSAAKVIDIQDSEIQSALTAFSPAFGRQEEFTIDGPTSSLGDSGLRGVKKKVKIFLSKNPVGFNESLKTIIELGAKHILLVLNDRIPDGTDVSWIWDVDFEMIPDDTAVIISGERIYDMAVRMKYAVKIQNAKGKSQNEIDNQHFITEPDLRKAISTGLEKTAINEALYILPTYSAMLEVRKILIGRKIL